MTDPVLVRQPRSDEAPALRELAERTFRAAFEAQNSASDLESYVREAFSLERLRAELADPASRFVVATNADCRGPQRERLLGYGKLRSGSLEPCVSDPDAIELERIYVEPSALGGGVGAALMKALIAEAQALGHRTIWLGVWERNERAIGFYRRWGFEVVGSHVFRLGSDEQTDLVMQRPVAGVNEPAPALRGLQGAARQAAPCPDSDSDTEVDDDA
ncbi:MAG TPA: N-acetyltransferase [Thermoanaerobaculia bacterium]|nr:N-acetyltransferase [Thermoanaerobaculia bacterium]